MYSDWLKIIMRLGTANESALLQLGRATLLLNLLTTLATGVALVDHWATSFSFQPNRGVRQIINSVKSSVVHQNSYQHFFIDKNVFQIFWWESRGGLVVSMLTFFSDGLSWHPTEAYRFFCKMLFEKNKNKQEKRPGLALAWPHV